MEYFIAIGLTFVLSIAIIILARVQSLSGINKIKYSQFSMHIRRKHIMPQGFIPKPKPETQLTKHVEGRMVKVIMIDDVAYWVKENIFYTAETKDGQIIPETARPVDTASLSKNEVDKMLFILDNLDRRNNRDDSGSTGN